MVSIEEVLNSELMKEYLIDFDYKVHKVEGNGVILYDLQCEDYRTFDTPKDLVEFFAEDSDYRYEVSGDDYYLQESIKLRNLLNMNTFGGRENMITTFRSQIEIAGARVMLVSKLNLLGVKVNSVDGAEVSEQIFELVDGMLKTTFAFYKDEYKFTIPRVGATLDGSDIIINIADEVNTHEIKIDELNQYFDSIKEVAVNKGPTKEEMWRDDHFVSTISDEGINAIMELDDEDIEDYVVAVCKAFEDVCIDEGWENETIVDTWNKNYPMLIEIGKALEQNVSLDDVEEIARIAFKHYSVEEVEKLARGDKFFMGNYVDIDHSFYLEVPCWLEHLLNTEDVLEAWCNYYNKTYYRTSSYGEWLIVE